MISVLVVILLMGTMGTAVALLCYPGCLAPPEVRDEARRVEAEWVAWASALVVDTRMDKS